MYYNIIWFVLALVFNSENKFIIYYCKANDVGAAHNERTLIDKSFK